MELLTTEALSQYCQDTKDLTAILEMFMENKAVTPKIISSVGECAKLCEAFLKTYSKML